MKIAVFWVVAPCSLVEVYQRFRGPCCLHHQGESQKTAIFIIIYMSFSSSCLYSHFFVPSVTSGNKKIVCSFYALFAPHPVANSSVFLEQMKSNFGLQIQVIRNLNFAFFINILSFFYFLLHLLSISLFFCFVFS
jgi:hypothetical protein